MRNPPIVGFPLVLPESRRYAAKEGVCPECGAGLLEDERCGNCRFDAFDDLSEPFDEKDLGCGLLILLVILLGLFRISH